MNVPVSQKEILNGANHVVGHQDDKGNTFGFEYWGFVNATCKQ